MFKKLLACLLLITWGLTSCTRELEKETSISITVPGSIGPLVATETLSHVIINARPTPASPPKVWTFDFKNSNIQPGQNVTLVVEGDIPASPTLLVQFLGVFESTSGGAMLFHYGDDTVDSTPSGDIVANISTESVGQSNKFGIIGGRYLTSTGIGPTGDLITQYIPVGTYAGQPPVDIMKTDMVNGFFSAFGFDGDQTAGNLQMKYIVVQDNLTVFDLFSSAAGNLNITADVFNGSDTSISRTTKVDAPASWAIENYSTGTEMRQVSSTEYIAGFFKETGVGWTTETPCYPQAGIIEHVYGRFEDTLATLPFAYESGGSPPRAFEVTNNGSATNLAACNSPNNEYTDYIKIYHNRLGDHGGDAFGMRGPFGVIDPVGSHDNAYLKTEVDDSGGNPALKFKWKMLPSVVGSGVDGAKLYAKYSPNGGGGGGGGDDDLNCAQQAASQGYTGPGMEIAPAVLTAGGFTLSTPPSGGANFNYNDPNSDQDSIYGWTYMLCPFRNVGADKKFLQSALYASCIGDCYEDHRLRFGRKVPGHGPHDVTVVGVDPFNSANIGGKHARIQNVAADTDPNLIKLTIGPAYTDFLPGSEVLAVVMSKGGAAGCGNYNGNTLEPGQYVFSRVVDNSVPNEIKVPVGSFVDNLIGNGDLNVDTQTDPHCFVQAVKVAEMGNLTIPAATQITVDPFDGLPNSFGGGVIAIRVNGTLSMTGTSAIFADAKGHDCLGGSGCAGYGPWGLHTAPTADTTLAGAGGSHLGQGGHGGGDGVSQGTPGPAYSNAYGKYHMYMGAAGGASQINEGGAGGGMIFLTARKIQIIGDGATISASGQDGSTTSGVETAGGGGAGGTVIIETQKVETGANNFYISVDGGMGPNSGSTDNRGAGGGGGGWINVRYCALTGTAPTLSSAGGAKAGGAGEDPGMLSEAGNPGQTGTDPNLGGCPP